MNVRGALIKVMPIRQISETFKIQEFYLDASSYNNMTGDKYANIIKLQIVNDKVEISDFKIGQVLDVGFYINGRQFDKKDNSGKGFSQNISAHKVEPALNTANEFIHLPAEQLEVLEVTQ